MNLDVAAIVNLHREGSSAAPSIISAWRAVDQLAAEGVDAELLLVLDSSNDETSRYARSWLRRGVRIIETNVHDLGDARNVAATATDAEWLAFLDGDDLWSENWLVRAYRMAQAFAEAPTDHVFHPARNIIFGDHHSILHHIDSTDPRFSSARARLHNPWTALSFVRRATAERLPYPRNDLDGGFGFEDWTWNLAALRSGGRHLVVDDTCHFIRRTSAGSLLSNSQKAVRSMHPVVHDRDGSLPGAASEVSKATATDAELPPTHVRSAVHLTHELSRQVAQAIAIEPSISVTLPTSSAVVPTNFNTHVTQEQRALEELELLASTATLLHALRTATLLPNLAQDLQDDVVLEAVRGHEAEDLGEWEQLPATLDRRPQLAHFLMTDRPTPSGENR